MYPNKWYQSKLEIARCRCDRWNAEIIIAPAGSWRKIQPRIQILAAIAEIVEFTRERSSLPFVAEGELMEFSTDRLLLVVNKQGRETESVRCQRSTEKQVLQEIRVGRIPLLLKDRQRRPVPSLQLSRETAVFLCLKNRGKVGFARDRKDVIVSPRRCRSCYRRCDLLAEYKEP